MEIQNLDTQELIQMTREPEQGEVSELTQLQLAIIGGGCAEVCPY